MQIIDGINDSLNKNAVQLDRQELCREVEKRFTPYIGQEFVGIEGAVTFYKIYVIACGFDVRRYTTKKWRVGEIKSKLIVCNREGFTHKAPNKVQSDRLVGANSQRRTRVTRLKIGATRTYKICKEHVNGFENVGASLNDFKNFHRDVKCFIHDRDGQLFVDHFKEMAETRIGFYFDYDIDDDGSLRRAIWVDSTARENYKIFGDAVSFDPTYSTNKYSMVFTPFTGVDHHKRSVTFCGALITREDYESFNWVFSRFLHAMGGSDYSDFMCKLNDIIWDKELEAAEFDAIWEQIIEEHGLGANDCFADTYAIRGQWVIAHCRDLKMASVMRTTQRSESENSFFKWFEHKSETFVEFWMRFESAMDQQRHTQKQLDNSDKHSSAKTSTHLALESHGAKVYTFSAFYTFKEEAIYSIDTCRTGGFTERDELETFTCNDIYTYKIHILQYKHIYTYTVCNIHTYMIALTDDPANGMKTIPDDYVVKRWTKECLRVRMFNCNGDVTDNMEIIDGKQITMSIMWSEVHQTVGLLRGKGVTDVESFSTIIRGFKDKLSPLGEVFNKNQQMEKILHCKASEVVTIFPAKNSKNKGSGKRMLSTKTKALGLARKPKRKCKNCKRMTKHEKRNCPNPFLEHTPLCEGLSDQEEDEEERGGRAGIRRRIDVTTVIM
ncbi:protein FAR1-RELATED SEQUENCE 9-like [Silene latifolia]|uniref:protein FAR1-RELATED SEQUENCE 9-like n=1 Tax=Silene latifolia TaxID=37657 RepID=UPI003D789069